MADFRTTGPDLYCLPRCGCAALGMGHPLPSSHGWESTGSYHHDEPLWSWGDEIAGTAMFPERQPLSDLRPMIALARAAASRLNPIASPELSRLDSLISIGLGDALRHLLLQTVGRR